MKKKRKVRKTVERESHRAESKGSWTQGKKQSHCCWGASLKNVHNGPKIKKRGARRKILKDMSQLVRGGRGEPRGAVQ